MRFPAHVSFTFFKFDPCVEYRKIQRIVPQPSPAVQRLLPGIPCVRLSCAFALPFNLLLLLFFFFSRRKEAHFTVLIEYFSNHSNGKQRCDYFITLHQETNGLLPYTDCRRFAVLFCAQFNNLSVIPSSIIRLSLFYSMVKFDFTQKLWTQLYARQQSTTATCA